MRVRSLEEIVIVNERRRSERHGLTIAKYPFAAIAIRRADIGAQEYSRCRGVLESLT